MANKITVEISARHIHLCQDDLDALFGKGYELTIKKELSVPGQYAMNEKLDVVGSKRTLSGVTILGPLRSATQVELSATDARSIGINAPIRESGNLKDSAPCKLIGPKGEIEIKEGVIIAKRHIHMLPSTADELGLKDKQVVEVKIETSERTTTFGDVVLRVNPEFNDSMHLDTDEGNAAGISGEAFGTIVGC